MKKTLVSFGGSEVGENRHNYAYNLHRNYTAEVQRLFRSGAPYFDNFWMYDNNWLLNSPYFQTDAKRVLSCHSFGWAFKSISIHDALSMVDNDDIVMWVDSNDLIVGDPQPIFDSLYQCGIFCHDHSPTYYRTARWTHKDMFVSMGCDEKRYWDTPQIQVNWLAFQKNTFVMNFVEEWVKCSIDYDVMIKNELRNDVDFVQHRHEQSIFSILREKYSLPYYKGYPKMFHEEMGICM